MCNLPLTEIITMPLTLYDENNRKKRYLKINYNINKNCDYIHRQ